MYYVINNKYVIIKFIFLAMRCGQCSVEDKEQDEEDIKDGKDRTQDNKMRQIDKKNISYSVPCFLSFPSFLSSSSCSLSCVLSLFSILPILLIFLILFLVLCSILPILLLHDLDFAEVQEF